jgi:hypothetical protein
MYKGQHLFGRNAPSAQGAQPGATISFFVHVFDIAGVR